MPLTTNPQEAQFFIAAAQGGLNAVEKAKQAGDLKEGIEALKRVTGAVTNLELSVIANSPNLRQWEKDRLSELYQQRLPAKDGLMMGLTTVERDEMEDLMDKVKYGEPIPPEPIINPRRRSRKIRRPNPPQAP